MKQVDFGKWVPDGDPKVGDLVECNGLIPYDGKLMPWLGAVALSSGAFTGTNAFVLFNVLDPSANNKTFIGTTTRIHRLDSATLTDVSLAAKYTLAGTESWDWCIYEDNLIMTTLGESVQVLADIDAGANFADLAGNSVTDTSIAFVNSNPDTITDSNNGLAGFKAGDRVEISGSTSNNKEVTIATVAAGTLTLVAADTLTAEIAGDTVTLKDIPHKSRCCAMYKDHLFLGNQATGDDGKERRLQISATGTVSDFAADTANGAGTILLPSFGEEIIALKGLGNYLMAYMTDSVYMIDFIGAPFWFSALKLELGVGIVGTHAVAQIDKNTHLALGRKDVYAITPGDIQPMGAGIRRRVIDSIHPTNLHRITHYVDRSKKVVVWSWPSTSGDGSPDKALVYNYEENRMSEIDLAAHCVGNIKSASTVINDVSDNINDVGLPIDDQSWLGGVDYNGAAMDSDSKVSYLGGVAADGFVETGEIDFDDVYRIRQLRPIIQKAQGTVTGTLKHRLDDNDNYTSTSNTMGANGLIDLQATGRYQKIKLAITGSHDGLRGCKMDEVRTGGR